MIELADVVRQLRAELDRAQRGAGDEDLRFELGPIGLEVMVALEAAGGAGAKVRCWVAEIGGDARATATSTQRIKLTLQPSRRDPGSPEGETRWASAYISGTETAGER